MRIKLPLGVVRSDEEKRSGFQRPRGPSPFGVCHGFLVKMFKMWPKHGAALEGPGMEPCRKAW